MERAVLLRKLMEEKNMKVSDIVKKSELPYSTVKAILERGAEKAGYVNVCKICKALDITADELEEMLKTPEQQFTKAAHLDGKDFTEEQWKRIESFAKFIKQDDSN